MYLVFKYILKYLCPALSVPNHRYIGHWSNDVKTGISLQLVAIITGNVIFMYL